MMNLMTKVGVVTLAAITVVPLATSIEPTVAQAKTVKKVSKKRVSKKSAKKVKTYKISKNILRNKKTIMYHADTSRWGMGFGIILTQPSAKKLRIIDSMSSASSGINYQIKKQSVKGNTMTLKLTPKLVKSQKGFARGNGTIKIIRTGKNSYKIPAIYRQGKKDGITRINKSRVNWSGNSRVTPVKTSAKFTIGTIKHFNKTEPLIHYGLSILLK